jgi:hypothetical protein
MVWLKTDAGRSMPVDAVTVEPGDETFDKSRHISHFATCPEADRFRKERKKNNG